MPSQSHADDAMAATPNRWGTLAPQLDFYCIRLFIASVLDMINRETIEQLAQQIGNLLGQNTLPQDVQRNLRALLQSSLSKLDVITQDEFAAQQAVLERTRAKLDLLETQLTELAEQLDNNELH